MALYEVQNNHKHLNYRQKDVWKEMNLFYTVVFYPFTATKCKCKIRSRFKIEYCIKNHSFKIINMLLTN